MSRRRLFKFSANLIPVLSLVRSTAGIMASNVNFAELLDKKYPSYTVEVNAFLNSCQVSNSIEVSAYLVYKKIENDDNVDSNLKLIYREAVFGSDKGAKLRIKNRLTHFRRTLRPHPKVKQLDMLHAPDYANMSLDQMNRTIDQSKKNDESIAREMQRQEDTKRKLDAALKDDDNPDDDVFCSDDDDCLKSKRNRMSEKTEESILVGPKPSTQIEVQKKEKDGKVRFGKSGMSKKSCLSLVKDGKTDMKKDDDDVGYAGPCSKEYKTKNKEKPVSEESMNLEPSDYVFAQSDSESNAVDVEHSELKTYGSKKNVLGKKKLLKKRKVDSQKLKYKPMSKGEFEFERIMNEQEKASEKDIFLTSKEDAEKVSADLKSAFNERASRSEMEKDEKVTLQKIRVCTTKVGKASVENTAFLRTLGVDKGLDVDKYREQVEKEVKDESQTEVQPEEVNDESEFVALPDMNEGRSDDYIYGGDPTLWAHDDNSNDSDNPDDCEELVQDESPLFQNQLADPDNANDYYISFWTNELE